MTTFWICLTIILCYVTTVALGFYLVHKSTEVRREAIDITGLQLMMLTKSCCRLMDTMSDSISNDID